MFTVCPKCALTLVVTPQDLRVAQGYVRCGRCSNVFNAIVGLTDDRSALAAGGQGGGQSGSPSTASTSIIRRAPSIPDDEPPHDASSETGESEAIYAEPDAEEVKFQEVFSEPAPAPAPAPISFVAPPPGPPVKAAAPAPAETPPPARQPFDPQKRYSDTEGIDTCSEHELEFNPDVTDVTKVFVEAATVTFKSNAATGRFEKIVLRPDEGAPTDSSAAARAPQPAPPATPTPPASSSAARPAVPARPPRDAEDLQIESELRSLAARLDTSESYPAPTFQMAANDAGGEAESDRGAEADADSDDRSIGDIYAKATPRPPPPRDTGRPAAQRASARTEGAAPSGDDDEIEADGAAETFTPAFPPRARFMVWVAGAAMLSLALVAQAIHHNRHDLATHALLNRPLTRFYKAIGVPLVPNWDLTAYDVRQLGASTNEGGQGTLTVRASLKNNATQPLPLPLLRITMQDRYGNRIATRDVGPTGYVPGAVPPEAHLGVGQRVDAEMTFKDPGQDAVGFEIDACLPAASGRIACANDQAVAAR